MSRAQTACALSALSVAALTGAAALARAPQLVSFAPIAGASLQAHAALPTPSLQPATARVLANTAAHTTLAKAILPGNTAATVSPVFRAVPVVAIMHRPLHTLVLRNISQSRREPRQQSTAAQMRQVSQRDAAAPAAWLVFTRWEVVRIPAAADYDTPATQPARQQILQPTYAAVPTSNGWIVLQL